MLTEPPDVHRSLPSSKECEEGLLGAILVSPVDVLTECMEKVDQDFFHVPANRMVYATLAKMWADRKPIDLVLVTQELATSGRLMEVGGPSFLTHLMGTTFTAANASHYIEVLRGKYILRQAISTGVQIANEGYEPTTTPEQMQESAQKKLLRIIRLGEDRRPSTHTMQAHVQQFLDDLQTAVDTPDYMPGLSTGLRQLDRDTGGLRRSAMIGIGGRTTRGKSVIGMQLGTRLAIEEGLPVGIWSGEMPSSDLTRRLISSYAMVEGDKLFKCPRDLTNQEQVRIANAAQRISAAPIYIDDQTGITISQLTGKIRKMKSEYRIEAAVIDYLQLIRPEKKGDRVEAMTDASAQVKALAGELEIPIITLLQLDEKNSIKWCKGIAGDCTDMWYIKHSKTSKASWLHIQKQRNGGRDIHVPVTWQKEYFRFQDRVSAPGEVAEED